MIRRFVQSFAAAVRGAWSAEASPVSFWPRTRRAPPSPIERLRKTAADSLRERVAARGRGWAWFELALATALWPGLSAARALRQVIRAGGYVARDHGVPRWRQFTTQLWLALAKNCAPRWYYQRLLYTPDAVAHVDAALLPHEVEQVLRRVHHGLDGGALDDKARFALHCKKHEIPAPRTFAVFDRGAERWLVFGGEAALPRCGLVLKPTCLSSGRGVERWDTADGDVYSFNGQRLIRSGLLARARARSLAEGPVLVQEVLANHDDVAPLGPSALCTLRITTYRFSTGESGAIDAGLRMPSSATAVVDNTGAGGLMAKLDLETGTLGGAASERDLVGVARVHPATGAPIEGRSVSTWREALRLCERAHATVPGFAFVAWDVGLTPDGPRLVEANTIFGIPDYLALGNTPFVRCALERLERAA